jgi:hypothetical protein
MAKTIQSKKAPSSEIVPRKFKYTPYVGVNLGDRDLTPIYISLPTPPADHLIDGYGLPPEEQYFRRLTIPPKLTNLHSRVIDELKAEYNDNTNRRVSDWKIYLRFWDYLERDRDHYEAEILFIKHVWWYRTYGYYFWNDGEIIFLPPDYFDFVNFFSMPDVLENGGFPEYRDKDRRKYTFKWYLENTDETFAELDENNKAIGHNGKYEMYKLGGRVFYGLAEPKTRRSGATYQSVHKILKTCMTGTGKFGTMVSLDGDNASMHYTLKFLPGWWNYPVFLKPISPSPRNSNSVRFGLPSGVYGIETLESIVTYTESAGERKNDGGKINCLLSDEEGKKSKAINVDINECWSVNQLSMSTGGGTTIWGWADHPSSIEEMNEGGTQYYRLCEQANFYKRTKDKGQTHNGLARCFFPNYDGLEGFIGLFGESIIDSPTERQVKLRPDARFAKLGRGARQVLQEEMDMLLKSGTPADMAKYRSLRRKQPMSFSDCWRGDSENSGFDIEIIETRLAELRRLETLHQSPIIRGWFKWVGERVEWVTDPEGRFEMVKKLPKQLTNQKIRVPIYDPGKDMTILHYAPMNGQNFIACGDTFSFDTESSARMRENRSRQSDGGLAVFWSHDSSVDPGEEISEWDSHRFVLSYRYRPNSLEDYQEDVLMACIFWGAFLFPESNRENLIQYFYQRGYAGYLLYDVDSITGRRKLKPGFYSLESSKDKLFAAVKDYIRYRGHKEYFASFLDECINIGGPDKLKYFDRFTAHSGCLIGLNALKTQAPPENQGVDLNKLSLFRKRTY